MDDLPVESKASLGATSLQGAGGVSAFSSLPLGGFFPTTAATRCCGTAPLTDLSGPAAQLAATQALTVALIQLLLALMQGTKNSGLAGAGPLGALGASGAAAGNAIGGGGATRKAAGGGGSARKTSGGGNVKVGEQQGQLRADAKGKVKPKDLQAYLEQRIARSKLNGFKPKDGSRYGVDGSAKSWAAFMTKLVSQESGYDTNAVGDVGYFRGGSRGLFQLSYDDASSYHLNGGKPFTASQLADPAFNADVAVAIMEHLVRKTGSISSGGGQYWGPIKHGWTG